MNKYLKQFVKSKFRKPAKALDLGAGDFNDVNGLIDLGWNAYGVDLKTGVNLEKFYFSPQGPFDLICSHYVFQKIKNRENFVKTIYENLKEGGWVFIQALDKSDKYGNSNLTKEEIARLFRDFSDVSIELKEIYDDWHNHYHKVLEVIGQK